MRLLSAVFCIILIVFGVSFSVLNSIEVPINYFIGQKIIYFPLLSLLLIVIGALLGVLAMLPVMIKLKMRKARSMHENA